MSDDAHVRFKFRIWLECGDGFSLGPGKAELLAGIEAHGSLSKAAEALGMSYRKAWGRLKKAEAALGRPLVTKAGGNKSGFRLTPFALELVHAYETWVRSVEFIALKKAEELLPFTQIICRNSSPNSKK